jgi:hypothetical protein
MDAHVDLGNVLVLAAVGFLGWMLKRALLKLDDHGERLVRLETKVSLSIKSPGQGLTP